MIHALRFSGRSFDFATLQASIDNILRTPPNNVVDIDNVKPDHLTSPVYAQDIIDYMQVSNFTPVHLGYLILGVLC